MDGAKMDDGGYLVGIAEGFVCLFVWCPLYSKELVVLHKMCRCTYAVASQPLKNKNET